MYIVNKCPDEKINRKSQTNTNDELTEIQLNWEGAKKDPEMKDNV